MARTKAGMEVAIDRRRTKPRFPQGSEVWISGCPKFGTAAKSGLTNQSWKRRWRGQSLGDGARFPAFFRVDRGRCRRSDDWLGFRPFAVDIALGAYRVLPARLRSRRGQRDKIGGRVSGKNRPLRDGKPHELKCRAPAWPAVL